MTFTLAFAVEFNPAIAAWLSVPIVAYGMVRIVMAIITADDRRADRLAAIGDAD